MPRQRPRTAIEADERTLRGVAAFHDLPADVRRRLENRCNWFRFEPHAVIVGYQDQSRDVFFVTRGLVRAVIYSVSGTVVAFRDIGPGQMFGEFAAIDGQVRSASIEAVEPCTIAQMTSHAFWELILSEPAVTKAVLLHLIRLIRSLSTRVYEFSTLTVQNRIHAELLRLAREHSASSKSVRIPKLPTHAEIASRISTHREAVSRELARLAKLGIVERRSGALFIPDIERLACMVEQATGD